MRKMTNLREEIAELEHEQWLLWIITMTERFHEWRKKGEELSKQDLEEMINYYEDKLYEQTEKWKENSIDYNLLPENIKEHDRYWADKVLKLFESKIDEKYKTLDNTNYDRFIAQKEILEELKQELKEEEGE